MTTPRIRATVLRHPRRADARPPGARYRVDETDDGFQGEEGTFTICSFWLVSALCEIGEVHKARKLCAKLLSLAGPLELYAEEIDAHSGQHLDNFPSGVHPPPRSSMRSSMSSRSKPRVRAPPTADARGTVAFGRHVHQQSRAHDDCPPLPDRTRRSQRVTAEAPLQVSPVTFARWAMPRPSPGAAKRCGT